MIRMNDFQRDPAELVEAEVGAFARVARSGWYILGKEVEAFEKEWAQALGAKHAVGVANGLDAIEIGFRALGIGPGDEVITTPMTAFATVLAVLRLGATPALADIRPDTGLLDLESVARLRSPRTRAVMLVHLFGQAREPDRWRDYCASEKIHFVEDCAQSHLAAWNGRRAGTFGAFAAHSFYPTKNLGALGDGGALTTESSEVAMAAAKLRNYGQTERYRHDLLGMNSRLDEVQAALLRERLKWLERFTERRREIASAYYDGIRNSLVTPLAKPIAPENHVYHLFVVRSPRRERLIAHLRERGIEAIPHYPYPVHQQAPTRELRRDPRGLKETEAFARECLSLPCHPHLSENEIAAVVAAVNGFSG